MTTFKRKSIYHLEALENASELNKPIYARTAAYGHFGREPTLDGGFTWEKLT